MPAGGDSTFISVSSSSSSFSFGLLVLFLNLSTFLGSMSATSSQVYALLNPFSNRMSIKTVEQRRNNMGSVRTRASGNTRSPSPPPFYPPGPAGQVARASQCPASLTALWCSAHPSRKLQKSSRRGNVVSKGFASIAAGYVRCSYVQCSCRRGPPRFRMRYTHASRNYHGTSLALVYWRGAGEAPRRSSQRESESRPGKADRVDFPLVAKTHRPSV
jgi:hypothetical protein